MRADPRRRAGSNDRGQSVRFRIGTASELFVHSLPEPLERPEGSDRVAAIIEKRHEAADRGLVVGCQGARFTRPAGGFVRGVRGVCEPPCDPRDPAPQIPALTVQPIVECRGPRHVEALQQITGVQVERLLGPPGFQVIRARSGIAEEVLPVERDFLVPSTNQYVAQLCAKVTHRLPKRTACPLLIGFGPEHADQGVSAVESEGPFDRHVGEDREALPRTEDARALLSGVGPTSGGAEQGKTNHNALQGDWNPGFR